MTGGQIWRVAEEMARRGWRISGASVMAAWRRRGFQVSAFGSLFPADKKPPALGIQLETRPRSGRALLDALGTGWREERLLRKPGRAVLVRVSRGPLRRSRILGELEAIHRALGGRPLDWPSVEGTGLASICRTLATSDGPWKIASLTFSRGGRPHASIGLHEDGRFWAMIFFWPPPRSRAFEHVTRELERAGYFGTVPEPPPGPILNLLRKRFSRAGLREATRLERLTAPRRGARAGS